ncbi:hypothetical protein L218DRAFT_1008725 [Marasmius fiardii PR-910]|nr:hypothetical protein L218DRAFT_1008725 [Marasmius fiardii PR-910]
MSLKGFTRILKFCTSFRQRARASKSARFLLSLTYLTLLSTTGQFISNTGQTLTGLSWSQELGGTISYIDRMAESALKAQPYGIASLAFQVLNFFAGDVIVVWRACILWYNSKFVRYVLCLLLAGSAGQSGNGFLKGDAASMFVSLGVNLAATTCIIVKAWKYRQSIRVMTVHDTSRKNVPFRILLSLVECGLFYCAVQIANGVLTIVGDAPSVFGRAVVSQFTEFFAGTYSALVISIIASQRSIIENSSVIVEGSDRQPVTGDIEKGRCSGPNHSTIRFATRSDGTSQLGPLTSTNSPDDGCHHNWSPTTSYSSNSNSHK